MAKSIRKRAASVHLDPGTWRRVAALAEAERRPISQLLRNIVADHVAALGRAETAAAGDQEVAA
jgi:hypothetical protein